MHEDKSAGLRGVLRNAGYDWTTLRTMPAVECLAAWIEQGLTQHQLRSMVKAAKTAGMLPQELAELNKFGHETEETLAQRANRQGSKRIWDRMAEKNVPADSDFARLVMETQRLWFAMSLRFNQLWDKPNGHIGDASFKNWVRLLRQNDITDQQLRQWADWFDQQVAKYPPKIDDVLAEMKAQNECAYKAFIIALEARRTGVWTDGRIFAAYMRAGGCWAFQHEPDKLLRPRFARCYAAVCDEAAHGESFPVPEVEKRLPKLSRPQRNRETGLEALKLLRSALGMPERQDIANDR